MDPKSVDGFDEQAAMLKMRANMLRLQAAMLDLAAAASQATAGLKRFADALSPLEEWPDVVLEDILDAEFIGE